MDILSTDQTFNELNYASPNVVYISLPDSSSTCGSYLSELPPLPSGWSYHCSATPTNIDGTGWIPIPFSNFPILNISQLFIDPINKPPYYYSFVVGGSYAVTAKLESKNNLSAQNDGCYSKNHFERGSDLSLILQVPQIVVRNKEEDIKEFLTNGLVGYWPFDEGSGTIAKDYSGNNNHGTIISGNWVDGKVGKALENFQVQVSHNPILNLGKQNTILFWVKIPTDWPGWVVYKLIGTTGWLYRLHGPIGHAFDFYDPGSTLRIHYWYPLPTSTSFYFLGSTYDGSKIVLYRATATASFTESNDISTNNATLIIQNPTVGGILDEIRLYNRALSPEEIKALYEATK